MRFLVALTLCCLAGCSARTETPAPTPPISVRPEKQPPPPRTPEQREISKSLRTRTPILVYHDFVERRDSRALWFDCTQAEFEQQLDWLKERRATFISIDKLYEGLTGGKPLPKNAILLTFADNYQGFYQRALPILRRRQIPAAMFVHTGFVGSQVGRPKMTWDQLRELDKEGLVTVCSQTVTHPPDLSLLSDAALAREMTGSKRELEQHLGHEISYLAYPNGKWNNRVASAAKAAGYAMAFTEAQAPAESATSLFSVARYVHTRFRKAWSDASDGVD